MSFYSHTDEDVEDIQNEAKSPLIALLKECRETLEFYAFRDYSHNISHGQNIAWDKGTKARALLEKLKEMG